MKEHNLDEKVLNRTTVKDGRAGADQPIQPIRELAKSYWDAPTDGSHTGAISDNERLIAASKRIKTLNNELHAPGGPLANSDLELIGFDRKGRLLMIHRNDSGHVDGKYLVDGESGKIVGKTKNGQLDKWEKSRDYDKASAHPADWKSMNSDGGTVWRDAKGNIREVDRAAGDKLTVTLDGNGKPLSVKIAGSELPLRTDGDYPHAEMLPDGTLQVTENANHRTWTMANGATVGYRHLGGHWLPVQTVDAYGNLTTVNRDESGAPREVTIMSGGTTESYRRADTVPGVKSAENMWVRIPEQPGAPPERIDFQVDSDGSLTKYVRLNERVQYKSNGAMILTSPDGKPIVHRPAFGAGDH